AAPGLRRCRRALLHPCASGPARHARSRDPGGARGDSAPAPEARGATMTAHSRPCAGLTVVEVAFGCSDLGLGMAGGVPGMLFADLGATVFRVVDPEPAPIDRDVAWGRAWHRDKHVIGGDAPRALELLNAADVALVYGSEDRIEQRGLG